MQARSPSLGKATNQLPVAGTRRKKTLWRPKLPMLSQADPVLRPVKSNLDALGPGGSHLGHLPSLLPKAGKSTKAAFCVAFQGNWGEPCMPLCCSRSFLGSRPNMDQQGGVFEL